MKKNHPTKPTGVNGPIEIAIGAERNQVEFLPIKFPSTKGEIEEFIVAGFLKEAKQKKILDSSILGVQQNKLDDFDFSLNTSSGKKALELMEIAPLENLRGSYEKAPSSYKPYEFAEHILNKLMSKSSRYASSKGSGIVLLTYITDWRFDLSNTVITLLQYWCVSTQHSFEQIYCYTPTTKEEGVATLIYPTPKEFWQNFNPETYKDNVVHNIDPTSWE